MMSVPVAKAGVGSAMNDTTRQLGGALGVAVLGPSDGRYLLRAPDHRVLCDAIAATARPARPTGSSGC